MVEDDEEGCGGLYIGRGTCVGLGLGILERLNDGRLSVLGERKREYSEQEKRGENRCTTQVAARRSIIQTVVVQCCE